MVTVYKSELSEERTDDVIRECSTIAFYTLILVSISHTLVVWIYDHRFRWKSMEDVRLHDRVGLVYD